MNFIIEFYLRVYRKLIPRSIRRKITQFLNKNKIGLPVVKKMPVENLVIIPDYKYNSFPFLSTLHNISPVYDYEPEETEALRNIFKESETFVDIGSNIGWFSLIASKYCKNVYCFEPNHVLRNLFIANFHLNNMTPPFLSEYALYHENKDAYLKMSRGKVVVDDAKSEEFKLKDADKKEIEKSSENFSKIKLRKFDDLVKDFDIKKIDIMKIDIEGAEINALKGMKKTLETHRPKILLGVHPSKMKAFNQNHLEVYEILKDLNYSYDLIFGGSEQNIVTNKDFTENYSLVCRPN